MNLTMLGTGYATATKCYNTCFAISDGNEHFLVDGGGGNGVLSQMAAAQIDWREVKEIFITHKHTDHLFGVIWMIRMICIAMKKGQYDGDARVYGHDEVIGIIRQIIFLVLQEKDLQFIDKRLHLVAVGDGEEREILGRKVTFFDVGSTKAKQFGFTMELAPGQKLSCCGDETYHENQEPYIKGSKWLLHEAFCTSAEADVFKPYEKHHATARDACRIAAQLEVKNLILYHTEDKALPTRKKRYTEDGKDVFGGRIFVPDDLESIDL